MNNGGGLSIFEVRHVVDMEMVKINRKIDKIEERIERLENRIEMTLNILSGIVDSSKIKEIEDEKAEV